MSGDGVLALAITALAVAVFVEQLVHFAHRSLIIALTSLVKCLQDQSERVHELIIPMILYSTDLRHKVVPCMPGSPRLLGPGGGVP